MPGLCTAYAPSHGEAEQTLLRLNRKLDEKLILLLCEFLDAVSRGEAADADESECMEPKDGESAPFSKTGLLLSTGHDIVACDILASFVLPVKSCTLAPGRTRVWKKRRDMVRGNSQRQTGNGTATTYNKRKPSRPMR